MDTVNTASLMRDEHLCQQNIALCISINYLVHLDGGEEGGKTNFGKWQIIHIWLEFMLKKICW